MDIKIEFSVPSGNFSTLDARPCSADVELKDGRDAVLSWKCCTGMTDADRGKAVVTGTGPVITFQDSTEEAASWYAMSGARVLGIRFGDSSARSELQVSLVNRTKGIVLPLDMYAKEHPAEIPWPELDRGARPMVRYFSNNGLPTALSCSGHPGTMKKQFWIRFRDDVTDHDIDRFMRSHAAAGKPFEALGTFCAGYYGSPSGIQKHLQYTAADMMDARLDLMDWVADDMSGLPGHGADGHENSQLSQAAGMCVDSMDPGTADELYRAIQYRRVMQDIWEWMEDNDEDLTQDIVELAARKYVYEGRCDCSQSYWANIEEAVRLARMPS